MKTQFKLNREWIDSQAFKIVQSLQDKGHTTYLVGGCVRDLLLDLVPKDFDIATSALPKEINRIIRPSHIIGRRFRLVLVRRYGRQYEISTFRSQVEVEEDHEGPIMDDNVFGSPEEDALRRDFTINGLFYDPVEETLIDHTKGLEDINHRVLRMIGDPATRIAEDPLRMLRALRFSHRTGFTIEPELRASISDCADKLTQSVLPRRREEFLKILKGQSPGQALWEAKDLGLLEHWIPTLNERIFSDEEKADAFTKTLHRANAFCQNIAEPRWVFGNLLFSLFSTEQPQFMEKLHLKDSQLKKWEHCFRHEISLFKSEQESFERSLKIILQLKKIPNVFNMRKKFQRHLLRSPFFSRAMSLCSAFDLIPRQELYFWLESFWRLKEEQSI